MAVVTTAAQVYGRYENPNLTYSGIHGLSNTTSNMVANVQMGYQMSDDVRNARKNMITVQYQKPQTYKSKYGDQLDSILAKIVSPAEFTYRFRDNEGFRSYEDKISRDAENASMDAMGLAAARNGGLGTSYGQIAGTQAYHEATAPLYDYGLNQLDKAYQMYMKDRDREKEQYSQLKERDETDYGRFRNEVADWQNNLQYATEQFQNQRAEDYSQYQDLMNYWHNQMVQEGQQYQTETTRAENKRQSEKTLAEQQRKTNLDEAYRRDVQNYQNTLDQRKYYLNMAMSILNSGGTPSQSMLRAAGLG